MPFIAMAIRVWLVMLLIGAVTPPGGAASFWGSLLVTVLAGIGVGTSEHRER